MPTRHVFTLTPREREIVVALRRGDTTRQIADAHGLGRQTVKNYLTSIYEKLGVTGRVELPVTPTLTVMSFNVVVCCSAGNL